MSDRENEAYEEGRRAGINGELLSRYAPTYKNRPKEWKSFNLGYLDGIREVKCSRKHSVPKAG